MTSIDTHDFHVTITDEAANAIREFSERYFESFLYVGIVYGTYPPQLAHTLTHRDFCKDDLQDCKKSIVNGIECCAESDRALELVSGAVIDFVDLGTFNDSYLSLKVPGQQDDYMVFSEEAKLFLLRADKNGLILNSRY